MSGDMRSVADLHGVPIKSHPLEHRQ